MATHQKSRGLVIEIPAAVPQQEIWDLEAELNKLEGVKVDLREPSDLIAASLLAVQIVEQAVGVVGGVAGAALTVQKAAQTLHNFLHPQKTTESATSPKEKESKHKVVVVQDNMRIVLYGRSPEEIETLLKEANQK
jgi:hypothetical protein